jgi:hypothetical protein
MALRIPLSEYLTTGRPDCEYIDGALRHRNVGETDHSRLQMLLSGYLSNREQQWGIIVIPEQRVRVKSERYRVHGRPSRLGGQPPFAPDILVPQLIHQRVHARGQGRHTPHHQSAN